PILLQSSPTTRNGNTYSFRFENIWLKEDGIGEVVTDSWNEGKELDITNQVSHCANRLQEWGHRKRMRFKQEVAECGEEMERLRGSHDTGNSKRYKDAQEKHARLLVQEEVYWRQRAKKHWLREGDLNTKFFHISATASSKVKKIDKLVNEQILK
ncbi:hypothetical protein A2U01_0044623, partial [Trifolium medium]|nr:hypothetical protein [Trifolium medium]